MKRIIISAVVVILGIFIPLIFANAQLCSKNGYQCTNPCCSGLECKIGWCMKPLGSSCNIDEDCFNDKTGQGAGQYMGCSSDKCCGRHWYPCDDKKYGDADPACCHDPHGTGAFRCGGSNYCYADCGLTYYTGEPNCTNWVNRGCAQGGCAANEIWQTRTCDNVICAKTQCVTDCSCNTTASSVCYNDDRYWNDACGNRTNNIRQDCGNDGCDAWTVNGCNGSLIKEIRTCHDRGCNNDACFDNTSTETRNGTDCGTDYCDNWVAAGCSGNFIQETRTCHDKGCNNGACLDTTFTETRTVTNCGTDSCDAWTVTGCDGSSIQETRTCHDRGCSNKACFDNTSTETRRSATNCDAFDGCLGTTFRNFSCSNGACVSSDTACDSRCDNPPAIPTLIAPPHNTWININPTFQARVIDAENETVRAYFNIVGYGQNWGSSTPSGGISQLGPLNLGNCAQYWWRVEYTEDSCGQRGQPTGYWLVKVDKSAPTASISYPNGLIESRTFRVDLSESENCSGIQQKDVDYSGDRGITWQDYPVAVNTTAFDFTAIDKSCYEFRYRVKDNANNWSGYANGGQVCVEVNAPPDIPTLIAPPDNTWINYDPVFRASVSDPNTNENIRALFAVSGAGTHSGNEVKNNEISHYGPLNLGNCAQYQWRAMAEDGRGLTGSWTNFWLTKIDKVAPIISISSEISPVSDTVIMVALTEIDSCSGIQKGEVEISTDKGSWQPYLSTIDDFEFTGSYEHIYRFRYRVQDNAGNWSRYAESESINIRAIPRATPLSANWIFCPNLNFRFTWNYVDPGNYPQASFQIQVDNSEDFSSPIIDTYEVAGSDAQYSLPEKDFSRLMNETTYYWQIRVKNSNNEWSDWRKNNNLSIFFKVLETYSTQ